MVKRKLGNPWVATKEEARQAKRKSAYQGKNLRYALMGPSLGRGPLLRSQKVTMRYYTGRGINAGVGGTAVTVFAANGMYDPDITGVGHQPRGFDELMPLYDHYVVIGVKCTVDFIPSAGETVPIYVGITLRDSSVTATANDYVEGGNTMYGVLSASQGFPTRMTMPINPNKFLGRSKPLADRDLKGSATTNPAELAFIHVWAAPANSGDDPGNVVANVLLEYTAVLIEPKVPIQS